MKNTKPFFLLSIFILVLLSCNSRISQANSTSLGAVHGISSLIDGDATIKTFDDCESLCFDKIPIETLKADDYAGSFLIEENGYFQSVYSSQNYDTFYQIYCKAHFYEKANEEYIESLEFRLINYKGPLNLGFSQNDKQISELGYKDSIIGLKLVVKGGSADNSLIINVKDKDIKKGAVETLNIHRILIPLYGKDIASSENGIFDGEFYTRSGIDTKNGKKLVPGLDGYPSTSEGGFDMDELLLKKKRLKTLGDGLNCYTSSIKVMW